MLYTNEQTFRLETRRHIMKKHDISDIAVTDEEVRRVNEWAREVHVKPALRKHERIMNTDTPTASAVFQALYRWDIDPVDDHHRRVWMRHTNQKSLQNALSTLNDVEHLDYVPSEIRRDAKLIWYWVENDGEIVPDEFNP